jgi:small-conductance mechanosensitive channel
MNFNGNIKQAILQFLSESKDDVFGRLVATIFIIGFFWVLNFISQRIMHKRIHDVKSHYRWSKIFTYTWLTLAVVFIGRLWFEGVQSIATFLGLLSAGVAIALKDFLINIAGWLFIVWRRPFDVGERIEIGDQAGDVIDISPFQFTLLEIGNWVDADQSTGRMINIPNGKVFSNAVANYQRGFQYIWNEIPVLLTFESDWKKAKQIMEEIADKRGQHAVDKARKQIRDAAKKFMIIYRKLTPIVYTDVEDSGVKLTMRYLCEVRKRRGSQEVIWEDILNAFENEESIDLAYPTTRIYMQKEKHGKL